MAQPTSQQQQLQEGYPADDMLNWQTNGPLQGLTSYAPTPRTVDNVSVEAAPIVPYAAQFPGSTLANTLGFRNNGTLPMNSPLGVLDGYHTSIPDRDHYPDNAGRRSMLVKSEEDSPDRRSWPTQMRRDFIQQPQTTMGVNFQGASSLLSLHGGYFSNSADGDSAFSPTLNPRVTNNAIPWGNFPSESPRIKQSSSQENSPNFQQSMHYPVNDNGGLGVPLPVSDPFDITRWPVTRDGNVYNAPFGQQVPSWTPAATRPDITGTAAWRQSVFPREQYNLLQPYNQQQSIHPPQDTSVSSGNRALTVMAREIVFDPADHVANPRTQHNSNHAAEEPKTRDRENAILKQGKRDGLTYKEIRALMGTDIAESTLRGRWRAISKKKKDRVRKPVWTSRDIRLLKRSVMQQLDDLDDGYRTADREHRISKISWKKASEYIRENGGTYTFGNATCKKKWVELEQEYRVET